MQLDLLGGRPTDESGEITFDPSLSQWMSPSWAAEAIVEMAFPNLGKDDLVIEPSCGIGRFLNALPAHVPAIGVEIDGRLADIARRDTGRTIVTGDFRTVPLEGVRATAICGNPPFDLEVFEGMLSRSHALLVDGAAAKYVLPAYAFQTTSRVMRWHERWTIMQCMIPRTLFPGISLPLVLATFVKERSRRLVGFLLYPESREVEEMPAVYAAALREGKSGWRAVVEKALHALGGEASLDAIYREIGPRRPTATDHWKAKVRQQLQRHFRKVAPATYAVT